jgi:hypothetical protein
MAAMWLSTSLIYDNISSSRERKRESLKRRQMSSLEVGRMNQMTPERE